VSLNLSLSEKFEEFCKHEEISPRFPYLAIVRQAFFAGAGAVILQRAMELREDVENINLRSQR
jgi:hypothetical protein